MPLSFPNPARSYDEAHSRVRFLGHDGMFEVRFYVLADVLAGEHPTRTLGESDYLAFFDALRSKILDAARRAYGTKPDRNITLARGHFA
ncbi:DUF1488 domain-containing protein [Rhizobium sp. TRM95796]|uniref:DUF1488 domain-containing protein n=1 Tax=Rhizobium sp. TRM95796 TaxID=2979862 RepID=UPI0021E7CEED|nr:DUF1488 domain-containing protein [Rhizobium sp. TRM95796]MCV3768743.1 DUF1488 domain-containing protein [Rhizobium sp. TRM95796]